MPRIRTIKPEFWTSEQIVECSTSARLLFIGLWNFCDDGGVHPASAKRLKMEVFPGDTLTDAQMDSLVAELIDAELVRSFEAEGQQWWCVTGWSHQKIDRPNHRFPQPQFDEDSTSDRRVTDEDSTSDHPRKGREGKVREGSKKEASASCAAGADASGDGEPSGSPPKQSKAGPDLKTVVDMWNQIDGVIHVSLPLTAKRRKTLKARMRDPTWDWLAAMQRVAKSSFCRGGGERGWKADFDWFLRPDQVIRLIEGKHDDRQGSNGSSTDLLSGPRDWLRENGVVVD